MTVKTILVSSFVTLGLILVSGNSGLHAQIRKSSNLQQGAKVSGEAVEAVQDGNFEGGRDTARKAFEKANEATKGAGAVDGSGAQAKDSGGVEQGSHSKSPSASLDEAPPTLSKSSDNKGKKNGPMSPMVRQIMGGSGAQLFGAIITGNPYLYYGAFATGATGLGVYLSERKSQTQPQKDEMTGWLMGAAGTQIFIGTIFYPPLILTGLATGAAAVGLYVYDNQQAQQSSK